jgi:hypothetical protein
MGKAWRTGILISFFSRQKYCYPLGVDYNK